MILDDDFYLRTCPYTDTRRPNLKMLLKNARLQPLTQMSQQMYPYTTQE